MQKAVLLRSTDLIAETRDRIAFLRSELRNNDQMVRTSRTAIRESMEAMSDAQLSQFRRLW